MSGSPVVIKRLEKKDSGKAARFAKRMIRWTMRNYEGEGYSKRSLDHLTSTAVQTLDMAIKDPNHYCLIAVKDGKIIGIALGQLLGGVGRIDWISVDPELHRQGIGKKLMNAVEKEMHARGCHKMTLFVFNSLVPALGLYLRWGLVPEATLKEHLFGDDYVIMSKWLENRKQREA